MALALTLKLQSQQDPVSQKDAAVTAYLSMPAWKYYTLSLLLYLGTLVTAIFITDLGLVFDIAGGFGACMLSFGLPGVLYLIMVRDPKAKVGVETKGQRTCNQVGAVLMITLSVVNFVLVVIK